MPRPTPPCHPELRSRDDRGQTLIEVLIAVVIVALAAVPLLGALLQALSSSGEHRSLATLDVLLKGFAETATSQIELSPTATGPAFNNCSGTVRYRLLSEPTPRSAAPGAAVTVFGIGFGTGLPLTTFHVTVGGTAATVVTKQSQSVSGSEMGNMQITFKVPAVANGPQTITVTDGQGHPISTLATTDLTVTPSGATGASSPAGGYRLGVTSVRYWSPGTATETSPVTACVLNGGLQLLTVHGRAGDGVSDTLTFDLRNPADVHVPVPTPSVMVTASPTFATLPASGSSPLVFTATVTPAAGEPRPAQPVTWVVTATGQTVTCRTPTQSTGSSTTEVYTCTVVLTPTSPAGRYGATATYPAVSAVNGTSTFTGFATVYGPNGSGALIVAPTQVTQSSTGNTLTFTYTAGVGGMFGGEVTVTLPPTGGSPRAKWTTPTTTADAPGYTVATIGTTAQTVVVSGTTIEVTDVTLAAGATLDIVYGQGGGSSGVTAPAQTGADTFSAQQASVPGVPPVALATSPTVTVQT